jgi:hypothetical protein
VTEKRYLVLSRTNYNHGASVELLSQQGQLVRAILPLNSAWMPDTIVRVKGLRLKFRWFALWGHHLVNIIQRLPNLLPADNRRAWRLANARQALAEQ